MSASHVLTSILRAPRLALGRLSDVERGGLVPVMARRELFRLLAGASSRQETALCLAAGGLGCLLIPLHRAYGEGRLPYLLLYGLLVQVALFAGAARCVWLGMRRDSASGSVEELLLTGARPARLLLGKCLGVSLAALLWSAMLLPALLLVAALTGAAAASVTALMASWALSGIAGALVGALAVPSSQSVTATVTVPLGGFVQFWIIVRLALPRMGSGLGEWWAELLRWIQWLDPVTLVPAAVGSLREPWWLKATVMVLAAGAAVAWMAAHQDDVELPEGSARKPEAEGFFSLRPVRAWLAGSRADAAPVYGRSVIFPFERSFGWRVRVTAPAWCCAGPGLLIPALALALIGREAEDRAALWLGVTTFFAAALGALGGAASVAADRELGRWIYLLSAPITPREIVRGKWRAVWLEGWPLWAISLGETLLLVAAGTLPVTALAAGAIGPPLAGGAAAAVAAAVAVPCHSLASAQQRALLVVLAPPAAAMLARWLLPGLPALAWASPAHLVGGAVGFSPVVSGFQLCTAAAAHLLLAAAALWAAEQLLRRQPDR